MACGDGWSASIEARTPIGVRGGRSHRAPARAVAAEVVAAGVVAPLVVPLMGPPPRAGRLVARATEATAATASVAEPELPHEKSNGGNKDNNLRLGE